MERLECSEEPIGTELVLIRHGATLWSRTSRHTGWTDIPLDAGGKEAARALAPVLAKVRIDRVLSSPLSRALETCRLAGCGDQVEIVDDLREWNYGDYEGRTTAEIWDENPNWDIWSDGCPGGEGPEDVRRRVEAVLARLGVSPEAKTRVACFAHGHILRALVAEYLERPLDLGRCFVLGPAHIGYVGFDRHSPVVRSWNS